MSNKGNMKNAVVISLAMLALSLQATQVYARDMGILPRDHARLFVGGLEFFFWEGMFCRHMADRYVVVPAPVGAVVTEIPSGAPAVVVDGTPYYTVNGVTYMRTSYGYQVVPPPSVIAPVSNVSTPAAPNVVVGAPTALLTQGVGCGTVPRAQPARAPQRQ